MTKETEAGDSAQAGKRPDKRKFRQTSQRLRGERADTLKSRAALDWQHDSERVCAENLKPAAIIPVEELTAILRDSMTGASLLSGAGLPIDISYDAQIPASQFYPDRNGRHIVTLNPYRPKGDLINLLSRELRRVWQHRHGALVNPLSFEPDEAILINRAQQADVLMASIRIAWELKLLGHTEAWDHIAGSPMSDVSRAFEVRAQTDFRTLNNGEASRAAYDKFFEDSRTKAHDKRIIHQMLLDETGYIKSTDKREKVSLDLFKRLGELPHGRNYLAIKSKHVPTDMCYATIEDRANANFLWFIKFERSFQEKEKQMIEESIRLSAEIIDFAKWSVQARRTKVPA